jgi:uncharacterized repeat protein (TIGR01451 family)
MNTRNTRLLVIVTALVGMSTGPLAGQVASSLLNVGQQLDPVNFPGHNVTSMGSPGVNSIGGFVLRVDTTLSGTVLSHAWGRAGGSGSPIILRTEGVVGPYTITSYSGVAIGDSGMLAYTVGGTGGPTGSFNGCFLDTTPLMIQNAQITSGPLAGKWWTTRSDPWISAGGIPFFRLATSNTQGGSSNASGMFGGNPVLPIVYGGMQFPLMPAPINDSSQEVRFSISRDANEYIATTNLETTGTGVGSDENVMMMITGRGLHLAGSPVQEGHPIPASIGGRVNENYSDFDDYAINEMGQYIIRGTSGLSASDDYIIVNGNIVLRTGQSVGGGPLSSTAEGADINESGDWIAAWKINNASTECIFLNGQIVLRDGDTLDVTGDGVGDPPWKMTDYDLNQPFRIGERDASGNIPIYMILTANNGTTNMVGFYRLVRAGTPGPAGDLEVYVTDSPDPQINIPGDITYKVKIRNNSGAAIDNVVVVSTLDPGLVFNAGASDAIAVHSSGTVTASLGTLAPYAVATYQFVATAPVSDVYTTDTSVAGDTTDTAPANNALSVETVVGATAELSVALTDAPDPLTVPGGAITYTLTAHNEGPSAASGVELQLELDPTVVFNAALSDPSAVESNGIVTIPVGALADQADSVKTIVVNVTTQGTVDAVATVAGLDFDPLMGNNSASTSTLYQLRTDLAITILDTPDPVVPAGGQVNYEVTATNLGPSPATGVHVIVTLDNATAFVSTDPPATHDGAVAGGVVSLSIGDLAASASYTFNIRVNTQTEGVVVATAVVAGGGNETDLTPANNTRGASTLIINDTSRFAHGVFSNITGDPTSLVPGIPGAQFGSVVDQPYRSPDGKHWIVVADTNLSTAQDQVIIIGDMCSAQTMVQEGVTTLDLGDAVGPIDTKVALNDAGQFTFTTNTDAATAADQVVVRWNGTQFVSVAREGNECAGATSEFGSTVLYSTIINAANIQQNGEVWLAADTNIGDANADHFLVSKNGNISVAREGVNIPTGQGGGASAHWDNFDNGELWIDADGSNYLARGDLDGSNTSQDGVFVVNDDVKIQEGFVLPGSGFSSAVATFSSTAFAGRMMSNGDWFARGTNANNQDWVVRNGTVLAATGQPIHTGATELYSDAVTASTFILFAGNNAGDFIIGGATNSNDAAADAVLVINGATVVSRENDPIDLDGNGALDDGVRIRTYGNEDVVLTEDLQAYVTVTLRDQNDEGANTSIGDAFIRINLCGVAGPCGDLDNDKDVDGDDFDLFALASGRELCDVDFHVCADFDRNDVISHIDYQHWLECYRNFVGNPLAIAPAAAKGDFNRDGDIDLADYAAMQLCTGASASSSTCRARFDFDADAIITASDVAAFGSAAMGPFEAGEE